MHSPLLCALFLTVIRLIHGVEDVSFALVEGQREDQLDQTRLVRLQRRGEIDELKKSLEAIQGRLKELEQCKCISIICFFTSFLVLRSLTGRIKRNYKVTTDDVKHWAIVTTYTVFYWAVYLI
jgi:hypothetical protein